MTGELVDLGAVRAALARLDELAEKHPQLVDPASPVASSSAWLVSLSRSAYFCPRLNADVYENCCMARTPNPDRDVITDHVVTLRITAAEHDALVRRVEARKLELADLGATVTLGSYVRSLIRRDLEAAAPLAPTPPSPPRRPAAPPTATPPSPPSPPSPSRRPGAPPAAPRAAAASEEVGDDELRAAVRVAKDAGATVTELANAVGLIPTNLTAWVNGRSHRKLPDRCRAPLLAALRARGAL